MDNINLESLLETLGHWGSVSVSRTRFPRAASPELKGTSVEWKVSMRIPGYTGKYGQPNFDMQGTDITQLVQDMHATVEQFLYSDEGRAARKHYVDEIARHNEYAARVNPTNMSGNSSQPTQMGDPIPDVAALDVVKISDEKYL